MSRTGKTEGYCVDLGCGDGSLALALARRSGLHVIAIDADPSGVAAAHERLDAAGLYGTRVTVLESDPLSSPLPDYLADLVVSGRSIAQSMPAMMSLANAA